VPTIKFALSFGVPVVFHHFTGIIHSSIDRVILERYVSLHELGIYTLGYQIGMVLSVIVSSFNKTWIPNYYELMQNDLVDRPYHVKRALNFWLPFVGFFCLIGSLWSSEFLFFMTPTRYHASAKIVPIILFGYVFECLYYFAVNPIFFYKKTKILPFATGSAALLNIGLNFLFIPKYGIMGAAYATVISFAYTALVIYQIGKRLFDPGYDLSRIIVLISVLFVGCILINFDQFSVAVELAKIAILIGYMWFGYMLFKDTFHPVLKRLITGLVKNWN
jgi:O-antigen/teichoic acid export membrane protein